MTYHVCDLPECGKESDAPMHVRIEGYWPAQASGILLPERFKHREFCSHACTVKWMRWALSHEKVP